MKRIVNKLPTNVEVSFDDKGGKVEVKTDLKQVYELPTLESRVETAKELIKSKNISKAKIKFFDMYYGKMYRSEMIRLDNLWAGYITEEEFTRKLERYAKSV